MDWLKHRSIKFIASIVVILNSCLEPYNPPEIDSVYWRGNFTNDDVEILLATHNPSSGTGKYRWRFKETWEYRSRFGSAFELINGVVYARNPEDIRADHFPGVEEITNCWKTIPSTPGQQDLNWRVTRFGLPPELISYLSEKRCMDCRTSGGVNKKPSFWID